MSVVACTYVALAMKRKSGFVVDTERAIQLSLIDSFEECDLCGLVLKACDLINKSPLLVEPEVFNRVIAAYMNEQEILRKGGSYCFNAN